MANKKISDLTAKTSVSSGDLLPLVDTDGTYETKHTTFQQVLDYVTGSDFTSLTASYVSGTQARFTSLTGNLEGDITGNAATVTNGAYVNAENTFTDNNVFTTITASSIDVDTITAREYYTELVTASVIYESGSTKFGNTSDDIHQFTGSILVDGDVSGSTAKFTNLSGNLDWSYVINEPTFLEANETITLSGDASGAGTTSITVSDVTASYVDWADVDNAPTFLEGNETITLSGDATGSGTTSIAIGDVTASFIKAGTDGSNLTSLTASQLSNFTSDVRGQFVAGDNIIINGGEISASLASAGDVFLDSDNTFTAVNTFNTHYITASAGITGVDANFSTITASAEVKVGGIKINGDLGNVAIGTDAHISNVIGQRNIAIGSNALENNTTNSNIGIGAWALRYNTTGRANVALGDSALEENVDSWFNVAIGALALGNLSGSNSETAQNTAIGAYSLKESVTGSKNTAVGYDSLAGNVYGSNNVAIGHSAGSDVITGSNNIFIGPDAATGETSLENTVIIRTDQDVMRIDDAGQLSASSFVGDGSSLTNLTASQISDFTDDVRGQFTAGTNITIVNGEISSTAAGSGDVLSGSDNTFTAVNTFDNHYITASVGVSGSSAIFDFITSSLFYNPQPTYFDSGVTNSSTNFTFRGTSSTTGRLLSVFKNTSEVFYVRHDGITYASSQFTVANELNLNRASIDGQSTGIWRTSGKPAHFVASGSTSIPAVRVGTKNNDDAEKIFAVSKDLYDPNAASDLPVDVLEILGDGTITLSGSSTKITTSGSSNLELAPGGTGAVRFNEEYKFPTADGVDGQVLTTDGLGNLTFETPATAGDVFTGGNNTLTGINTFNTHYVTASEGITGGDAKFTSLSGNIDWAYVVGEPTDLSGYGITDAVDFTSTQTITGQKTFSDQNNEFTGSFIASNIIERTAGLGIPMSGNVDINGSIVADIEIPAEITSTSYTVDLSDRGRTLLFNNAATQEITCSAGLNTGFTCTFIQMGAGQLILTASSGATLLNRQDHTGSAGQYAAVSIIVVGSNQYLIAGDTV